MGGVVFIDYETVKTAVEQTSTNTGLSVIVRLNLQNYTTGSKINKEDIDKRRIKYHPKIPDLNYRIYP
jgi:hypothetical protein